ncbi:ArsR/SmtB family transcription factor [Agaribacter marinus]|uniref:Transcriptional regulator n=1 Tax=Agaribacter marinus TaxID=1431249 RepID=A0AA37T0Q4_9ALTE|nr:helix-turn-helix domain-containing protein [Agaribacter marinus]GLR71516.1 transcriptional regulator [Agaribacter marinus]
MDIFSALSDPTRRHILEQLNRLGPQSIKQLNAGLPITRQALTKHLNRLIKAKLVMAEFSGKEKVHKLNPNALLTVERWIAPFAKQWDKRLQGLQIHMENKDE